MKNILVTGANGFVGRVLCGVLADAGNKVRGSVRDSQHIVIKNSACEYFAVGDIDSNTDWVPALNGMDAVVHLAARVHVMRETAVDPLMEFRRVNVEGTERLARQAVSLGVKRFVYVSSIKVNGQKTTDDSFAAADLPAPQDPYALSKWEAEQVLHQIAGETGLEVVVIRPPLVYGPGVRGNFLRLLRSVDRGVPLPFGSIENCRSLVSVFNLCDLLRICLEHPKACGEVFLIKDGEDLSTAEIIRRIASAMHRPCRLVRIPVPLLRLAGALVGRGAEADRLCDSLQMDMEKTRVLLDWTPPVSIAEGLKRTVDWFLREGKQSRGSKGGSSQAN